MMMNRLEVMNYYGRKYGKDDIQAIKHSSKWYNETCYTPIKYRGIYRKLNYVLTIYSSDLCGPVDTLEAYVPEEGGTIVYDVEAPELKKYSWE